MARTIPAITRRSTIALENHTDAELVAEYQRGNELALVEIDRRYRERLTTKVAGFLGDRSTAEDMVQFGLMRMLNHLHTYNPEKKFSTWLFTIVMNRARNENRDRKRRLLYKAYRLDFAPETARYQIEVVDKRPIADEVCEQQDIKAAYEHARSCLSGIHAEIYTKVVEEDLTYEEAAQAIGICVGTAKSRLNRARASIVRTMTPMVS